MIRALVLPPLAGVAVPIIGFAGIGAAGVFALPAALPLLSLFAPADPFPDGAGLAFALPLSLWLGAVVPPAWLAARAQARSGPARAGLFLVALPAGSVALAAGLHAMTMTPGR